MLSFGKKKLLNVQPILIVDKGHHFFLLSQQLKEIIMKIIVINVHTIISQYNVMKIYYHKTRKKRIPIDH